MNGYQSSVVSGASRVEPRGLDLLWVSTKLPWPPRDGGRLAQSLTIEALVRAGARVTVIAPGDPSVSPPPTLGGSVRIVSVGRNRARDVIDRRCLSTPLTVVRACPVALGRAVGQVRRRKRFDAIHVEQIHAWPAVEGWLTDADVAVLRTQNVESDLWRASDQLAPGWSRVAARLLRTEARRWRGWEQRTLRRPSRVIALTPPDARRLRCLAPGIDVAAIPPPFPERLDPGDALPGQPAVVVFGDGRWAPNRDAIRWFLDAVWPVAARRLPEAHLHIFSDRITQSVGGVTVHPRLDDSQQAFPVGGVQVVPLRVASGVRMKILESWARGVPVIASRVAARGLPASHGRELMLADEAEEYVTALRDMNDTGGLRQRLVAGGRRLLRHGYSQEVVTKRLLEVYLTPR